MHIRFRVQVTAYVEVDRFQERSCFLVWRGLAGCTDTINGFKFRCSHQPTHTHKICSRPGSAQRRKMWWMLKKIHLVGGLSIMSSLPVRSGEDYDSEYCNSRDQPSG
jgi:hypothetical protein